MMNIEFIKSENELMVDIAVEIRELIPESVNGLSTYSMVNSPTEVFLFAKLYIEELQSIIKGMNGGYK